MRLLKRHRLSHGLSIAELAARLKVDASTVGAWESGRNNPRPRMYPKIARVLGVDPLELTRIMSPEPEPAGVK